jgi:hypothetical protein
VSEKDSASGYAGLTAGTKLNLAQLQEVMGVAALSDFASKSGSGAAALGGTITTPGDNEILGYLSGDWINRTLAEAGIQAALGFTPVPNTRLVSTTAPLAGGGALSGDLTLSITGDGIGPTQIDEAANYGWTSYHDYTEIAVPANPGAGIVRLYAKTGTGELCGRDNAGTETCMSDGPAGSGISTLNTLTPTTQTFTHPDDTNVVLTINSAGSNHEFALSWAGLLATSRANADFRLESEEHAGTDPETDLEEEIHAPEHASGGGDAVDHDTLSNFVANEHIDHSAVSLTAGVGLTGGGDISAGRTFDLSYTDTLIGNPALPAENCVFTTDGAGGGGMLCEGTGANTNEQLYLFPAADGADTTEFIVVDATQVTDLEGVGLAISAGVLGCTDAAADDATKGCATFDATRFSAVAGNIDIASVAGVTGANEDDVSDDEPISMLNWPVGLTLAELGYVADVTGLIQAQLDDKAATDHDATHSDGGADEIVAENLASACTDVQVLGGDGLGGLECQADVSGGSPAWETISNPGGNQALTMAAYTTTWTYGATTGAGVNLVNILDTTSNTGTGYLFSVTTASGSAAKPMRIASGGTANGVEMTTGGLLQPIGTGGIQATEAAAAAIDAITEIAAALRVGADLTLLTGTAGGSGDLAIWNVDGDVVDGPTYSTTSAANVIPQADGSGDIAATFIPDLSGTYQPLDPALTALAGGSDFVRFTGPTASIKQFTLPNAAAAILTDNALITVAQGGSGAGTLTGLLQGNGTGAFTTITNSSTVGQVLRVTGTSAYGFGAVDLGDSDARTGVLAAANVDTAIARLASPVFTGTVDVGGAQFELPNGAAPTTDGVGEAAIDTTSGQFQFHDGTAERALPYLKPFSIIQGSIAATDDFLFMKLPWGITVTAFDCIVGAATSATVNIQECSATGGSCTDMATADLVCDTDGATTSTFSNASADSGDWLRFDVASISGTPGDFAMTVSYRITPD